MNYREIGYIVVFVIISAIFINENNIGKISTNALKWFLSVLKVLITPKLLLTFGVAWFITNGWSYFILVLGQVLNNKVMLWIGASYQAFLWFPFTAEKIVTVAIAIFLAKWLFPKDVKLQKMLRELNPVNIIK